VRVVIVDDHLAFAEALALALEPEHTVLAAFGDGNELMPFLRENLVDAILLDTTLPRCDIRNLIGSIRRSSNVLLIMMTGIDDVGEWPGLHRFGAHGMISKSRPLARFRASMERIAALDRPVSDTLPGSSVSALTPRQEDVLRAIARDLLRKEIAQDLHLSEARVDEHVAELKRRYGVRTTAGLVLRGIEEGVIEPWLSPRRNPGESPASPPL